MSSRYLRGWYDDSFEKRRINVGPDWELWEGWTGAHGRPLEVGLR